MVRIVILCLLMLVFGGTDGMAANDIGRSPLLIDTPTTAPIFSTGVKITSIRWVNVTTAGHKLILVDSTGRRLFETTAPAGASEYELPLPLSTTKGLSVLQIDSGTAYISFE